MAKAYLENVGRPLAGSDFWCFVGATRDGGYEVDEHERGQWRRFTPAETLEVEVLRTDHEYLGSRRYSRGQCDLSGGVVDGQRGPVEVIQLQVSMYIR